MAPSPLPLSKRNEGCRAEAIFAYSSNGLATGEGRDRMRGEGEPSKNGIDEGEVLGIVGAFQPESEITIPHRFLRA
ncbi:MAG: hypothetical protein OJF51_002839 [Nitrospira sp.]|nr:MAG: hypothetical protein OJF51_002839 [Nitrospira sp.]